MEQDGDPEHLGKMGRGKYKVAGAAYFRLSDTRVTVHTTKKAVQVSIKK